MIEAIISNLEDHLVRRDPVRSKCSEKRRVAQFGELTNMAAPIRRNILVKFKRVAVLCVMEIL